MPLVNTSNNSIVCLLCFSASINNFCQDRFRSYFHCGNCGFIFADPEKFLSPAEEKTRYDTHRNNLYDSGYRQFLFRLVTPLSIRLGNRPLEGLDFGSGPGPALSIIMREKGYQIATYDPYYADNPEVLKKQTYKSGEIIWER